ncbi:putative ribonuclease H protein [Nymphaea thermarum]|nr:putative ribonuclease H protein [Nymphaea thermarum]
MRMEKRRGARQSVNLRHLKGCLDEFSSYSGLVMNIDKSLVLSFNMNSQVLSQTEREMGWHQGQLPTTYLGIPLQTTDLTEAQCRSLTLRSTQKLAVWKQKCLSFAGRLSLIKHVLSLVPSYWSLVVKIAASTCKHLNKMAADFLWGDMADCKRYHRMKWSTLCLPKLEGGVGQRDIKETNMANMAFLVYRVSQETSPWASLVKGHYCEWKGLLDSSIRGKRASIAWHRALQSWRKIKEQVAWKIGNGSLVKFWTDHWGEDRLIDKVPITHLHLVQDSLTCSVKEIIEHEKCDYTLVDINEQEFRPQEWFQINAYSGFRSNKLHEAWALGRAAVWYPDRLRPRARVPEKRFWVLGHWVELLPGTRHPARLRLR